MLLHLFLLLPLHLLWRLCPSVGHGFPPDGVSRQNRVVTRRGCEPHSFPTPPALFSSSVTSFSCYVIQISSSVVTSLSRQEKREAFLIIVKRTVEV
jgi:hypothetical protein